MSLDDFRMAQAVSEDLSPKTTEFVIGSVYVEFMVEKSGTVTFSSSSSVFSCQYNSTVVSILMYDLEARWWSQFRDVSHH
jgi:hypothetical protein